MAETAVAMDLVLENLEELLGWPFSDVKKRHMGCLSEELGMLRSSLKDSEHGEVVNHMRDVILEAADIIDWYRVSFMLQKKTLGEVLREIRSMKESVRERCEGKRQEFVPGSCILHEKTLGEVLREVRSMKKAVRERCEGKRQEFVPGEVEWSSKTTNLYDEHREVENLRRDWLRFSLMLQKEKFCEFLKQREEEVREGCERKQQDVAGWQVGVVEGGSSSNDKDGFLYPHRPLSDVLRDIESIRKEVDMKIYQTKLHSIRVPQVQISTRGSSSAAAASEVLVNEETMVGFESEVVALRQRLTSSHRQRQVISIVGMAGSGKTTLARNLYNDPFITYHFYIRGWSYVSQVYRKKDVLLGILSCLLQHKNETFYSMNHEKLGEELYKRLCGSRYLIVLDDMWDIRNWNDLKTYFPNDNNGSRIMFTTRITDVAMDAEPSSTPHHLRFLNEDESNDLFYRRVCVEEGSHKELMTIGKQIALKCQGLPLAIVVVAGLLAKTEKTEDWWKKVADRQSSYIVTDQEQCMDILTLSYNNLPNHLKLCFLYLGAFSKKYEISARRLTWLWIAEGFVRCAEERCLEEVAEDYLMELADRKFGVGCQNKVCGGNQCMPFA